MRTIIRVAFLAALATACSTFRLGMPDRRAQTDRGMRQLADVMEKYHQATGSYPATPDQLAAKSNDGSPYAAQDLLTDQWGHPYRIEIAPPEKTAAEQIDYKIISAGEDGQFGNADDLVYSHRKH